MRDIRLEELPFEFGGKTYLLRCNMNVLADVQEIYGGDVGKALSSETPTKSVLHFLAAMMNDYAEDMGWPERFTARQIGRRLTLPQVPTGEIMGLVIRALVPPNAENEAETAEAAESGPESTGN